MTYCVTWPTRFTSTDHCRFENMPQIALRRHRSGCTNIGRRDFPASLKSQSHPINSTIIVRLHTSEIRGANKMPKKLKVDYLVMPDAKALAARAAEQFTQAAKKAASERGRARIAISGGSTPKEAFQLLADPTQPWRERMPWDKLDLFWVDERCVPPDHPDSNYRMT